MRELDRPDPYDIERFPAVSTGKIDRDTIKRISQEHRIDPPPERGKRMPWSKLIKAHLGVIIGMDFLTVEAVTWLCFATTCCSWSTSPAGRWRSSGSR